MMKYFGGSVEVNGNGYTFREDNSFKIVLPHFWKVFYTKRKEFAPARSKFFFFLE